jgi:hypothetical protein
MGISKRIGSQKALLFLVFTILIFPSAQVSDSAPIAGSSCKKIGKTYLSSGKTFKCIQKNGKTKWVKVKNPKVELIESPTSFENLYENRKGISKSAWEKVAATIQSSKPKVGDLEIHTGPNTKPFFDDYPLATSLISRAFPNHAEPDKTLIIRYNFADVEWAEKLLNEKVIADDLQKLYGNASGKIVANNCNQLTKNCTNGIQQTAFSNKLSIILQGIRNTDDPNDETGKIRFYSGMLEAHEYFHALQRIPIMGKSSIWPHAWFREGSAEWIQNAAIYYKDFETYKDYLRLDCQRSCLRLREEEIAEFLTTSNEEVVIEKFEPWLNYSLGSWVIEALVALKGPEIMLDMYAEMGKGLSFDQSFNNLFQFEWNKAIPILAKTIYANLRS